MQITRDKMAILQAVIGFAHVEKYQGTLPRKLALMYDEDDVQDLVAMGLLEWTTMTYSCGRDVFGLRATVAGKELADECAPDPQPDQETGGACIEFTHEHLTLLSDIYHYSKVSHLEGLYPERLAKGQSKEDLDDLFDRGLIIKVRVNRQDDDKRIKGFLLSSKGKKTLRQHKLQ